MEDLLLGFLYAVAGILIGGLTTHLLGKSIIRRNEFNNAAERFIFAFQDELSRLKHSRETTAAIIQPAIFKHQTATSIFKRWLPCNSRCDFDRAWKDYLVNAPSQYEKEAHTIGHGADDKTRFLLVEKIERLLDFAEFK